MSRTMRFSLFCLMPLIFVAGLVSNAVATAEGPGDDGVIGGTVLETYCLDLGNTAEDVKLSFDDGSFGGGDAELSLTYTVKGSSGKLRLNVRRTVPPGQISFALLVFGIEVRGYDAQGNLLLNESLDPFSFGDSASGNWRKTLRSVPAEVSELEIRFFGNYE